MTSQFWLWFDVIAMLAGGSLILAIGKRRTGHEEAHTVIHGIVPIIAACLYLLMATGQGSILLPILPGSATTRIFYFGRYIDWTFTTPLLLMGLAYTSMPSGLRRGGAILGMLLADVMMIGTALAFGASVVEWIKWTWFIVSCVAFLGVYYVMWVALLQEAGRERAKVRSDYVRDAAILSVLWFLYPVILGLGTDGTGILSSTTSVALIAIVDLLSKVAYGLLSTVSTGKLVDEDLNDEGKVTASARRAA
ncbi:bacteriorhodopsin [Lichenicoccus sp.]|uniref:bacteriorhodopsin n=1 Tax=Lichenicoccus sp. TaxID=2781899 RepID=UPI003D0EBD4D